MKKIYNIIVNKIFHTNESDNYEVKIISDYPKQIDSKIFSNTMKINQIIVPHNKAI